MIYIEYWPQVPFGAVAEQIDCCAKDFGLDPRTVHIFVCLTDSCFGSGYLCTWATFKEKCGATF